MSSVEPTLEPIVVESPEVQGFSYRPSPLEIVAALTVVIVAVASYIFAFKDWSPYYIASNTFNYLYLAWWDPDYQHGFFVVPFCLFLLWYRRDMLEGVPAQGSWWGVAFFALYAVIRLVGTYGNYSWFHHAALVPCVAGIVLFVGGWRIMAWAWPSIVFLLFMIPLPGRATDFLSQPLQKVASVVSTYVIQTLGIPVMRQDVTLHLRDMQLNVAEACSGIRMLMLFFALCVAAAFLMRKSTWWERLGIVATAIPIAIIANISRLCLIAIFCEMVNKWPSLLTMVHGAEALKNWPPQAGLEGLWPHDLAGLLMMPIGLLLLLGEWVLYSKLFVEVPEDNIGALRNTARGLLPSAPGPRKEKSP
jgi:exosortase